MVLSRHRLADRCDWPELRLRRESQLEWNMELRDLCEMPPSSHPLTQGKDKPFLCSWQMRFSSGITSYCGINPRLWWSLCVCVEVPLSLSHLEATSTHISCRPALVCSISLFCIHPPHQRIELWSTYEDRSVRHIPQILLPILC